MIVAAVRLHRADAARGVRHEPVVIRSLDDDNTLEETAYLLRSPKGAKRLMDSVEQLCAGGGEARALIQTDDAA